jgi:hypothetical protein
VEGYMPAFRLDLANVGGQMGMTKSRSCFFFLNQHVNWQVDSYIFGCLRCRYVLEGKELEFYQKKIHKKKGKGAAA